MQKLEDMHKYSWVCNGTGRQLIDLSNLNRIAAVKPL